MIRKFFNQLTYPGAVRRFVLAGIITGVTFFILQKYHQRDALADFRVYYDACNTWLRGESPYGQAFGISSGYYKYSPSALIPFSLLVWMPYDLAAGIYYFLILAALILFSVIVVLFIEKQFALPSSKRGWILTLSTIFLADHFERELHLGNVNAFLLITVFVLYQAIRKEKMMLAGLLYACILLFKPHFLILFPYFIWHKNQRLLAYTLVGITAGFLLPAIISGWNANIRNHLDWITAMQDHNLELTGSPNTIYGIVNGWILERLGIQGGLWLIALLLICAMVWFLYILRFNRIHADDRDRIFFIELFILVALIPNLTHTDTEHFMWSWLLIVFIISLLFYKSSKWRWLYIMLMLLVFVPYTLNSPDIVGRRAMLLFDSGGLLGMANLLIILIAVKLFSLSADTNFRSVTELPVD